MPEMGAGRERCFENGGLDAGAGQETDFGVEVFFGDAATGVNVDPIVGVGEAAAESGVVRMEAGAPGFGVITVEIEIFEEDEFCVEAAGAVVGIEGIAGFLVGGDETDIGAGSKGPFDADDGIVRVGIGADGASADVHDAEIETGDVTGDFSTGVDGDFLASVWVDTDLAGEKEKVLIPKKKIEDVGILEEEAAFFWDFNWERSEIELLLIDVGV